MNAFSAHFRNYFPIEINIMQSRRKLATADGMKHEVTIFTCCGIYVAYR
jgi:hypothetical protein